MSYFRLVLFMVFLCQPVLGENSDMEYLNDLLRNVSISLPLLEREVGQLISVYSQKNQQVNYQKLKTVQNTLKCMNGELINKIRFEVNDKQKNCNKINPNTRKKTYMFVYPTSEEKTEKNKLYLTETSN